MDLDANALLASLLIGSIGFVLFVYGKKQQRLAHMITGVVLFIFPYFVPNALISLGITAVLLGGLWLGVRRGL